MSTPVVERWRFSRFVTGAVRGKPREQGCRWVGPGRAAPCSGFCGLCVHPGSGVGRAHRPPALSSAPSPVKGVCGHTERRLFAVLMSRGQEGLRGFPAECHWDRKCSAQPRDLGASALYSSTGGSLSAHEWKATRLLGVPTRESCRDASVPLTLFVAPFPRRPGPAAPALLQSEKTGSPKCG